MSPFLIILILAAVFSVAALSYNNYVARAMARRAAREPHSVITGVLPGAESIYLLNKGPRAVLMLHGFNGSPQEFGTLPERFFHEGYSVAVPLLPGHGKNPWDMKGVGRKDWMAQARKSYAALSKNHESVSVVGLSLGAALSVLLAAEQKSKPVKRLVLLAPFFQVKHRWFYLLPLEVWLGILAPMIPYVKRLEGLKPVYKAPEKPLPIAHYQCVPTQTILRAFETAHEAARVLPSLKVPMLMLHSRKDLITDYQTTHRLVQALDPTLTRLVSLEKSNHVIPLDYDAGTAEAEIVDFLTRPEKSPPF